MSQHQETKKERIIRTALEIFAHKGFHPATMSEIAKASGVAKGSLYNYFTSKEDLLKKLILETIGEVGHMIDPDGNGTVTREEFFEFIHKVRTWVEENRTFFLLYISVASQPKVFQLFEKEIWPKINPLMEKLENFFAANGIDNPHAEVRFLDAMLDGMRLNYAADPEHFPLHATEQKIIDYYKSLLNSQEVESNPKTEQS
jgi:AcrR family transcriptional regulator